MIVPTRMPLSAMAFALALALLPRPAAAQGRVVECSSMKDRYAWCRTGGLGSVRLVRQLSHSPCILWQTWGPDPDGGGIWVREGCRGQFAVSAWGRPPGGGPGNDWNGNRPGYGPPGTTVRCASRNWSFQLCPMRTQGRQFRLERQFSRQACIRDDTWGIMPNGLWVDRGCDGEFGMR